MITLQAIAHELNASLPSSASHFYVENIGGGVHAVLDYTGLTVTINDGQRAVDTSDEGPAEVLICRDGAQLATGPAATVADVLDVVRAATPTAVFAKLPTPLDLREDLDPTPAPTAEQVAEVAANEAAWARRDRLDREAQAAALAARMARPITDA